MPKTHTTPEYEQEERRLAQALCIAASRMHYPCDKPNHRNMCSCRMETFKEAGRKYSAWVNTGGKKDGERQ